MYWNKITDPNEIRETIRDGETLIKGYCNQGRNIEADIVDCLNFLLRKQLAGDINIT